MLKVMTLNLWRYHDWDQRIDNIIALINKEAPDCIAFQEVLTNHAFSEFPSSDYIADKCGFKYRSFAPTLVRNNARDKNGNRTQRASEGQAFISKHPIVKSESYFLKYYPEYPEEKAVLFCSIDTNEGCIDTCNVHFANSDVALKHLDELLVLIKKRNMAPIILGDYNIYNLDKYKKKNDRLKGYTLSSELLSYTSFPEHSDTLDYIVVPASNYKLCNVICSDTYVSDHRALFANISKV